MDFRDLGRGFRSRNYRAKPEQSGFGDENQLIIMVPDCRVLRLLARSVLLVMVLVAFPWIGMFLESNSTDGFSQIYLEPNAIAMNRQQPIGLIPTLFGDLMEQGLLNLKDRALCIGINDGNNEFQRLKLQGLAPVRMDMVSDLDTERQGPFPDESFDFEFANSFDSVHFVERTLKIGGVAAINLSICRVNGFRLSPNFKIVYLKRFESSSSGSTFLALRKVAAGTISSAQKRRLCPVSDAKTASLSGLENILLEPPQESWIESKQYISRAKILPVLISGSLAGYTRRVFIHVTTPTRYGSGGNWSELEWYYRDFDVYNVVAAGGSSAELAALPNLSEWLVENVKGEEFVAMKIGAAGLELNLVEEMVKSKAVCLVDELFLACPYKENGNNKRTYWECLAVYGMLREEGIAVHQWWG